MNDYNPYIVLPVNTAEKALGCLNLALRMAEDKYPHLTEEIGGVIERFRRDAETFTGTQNKPITKKAYNN